MLSWLTKLFGSSDSMSKTMDIVGDSIRGVGNWIDERDFTEEEKSKANADASKAHLDLIKAIKDENSTRSITRRWMGFLLIFWILFYNKFTTRRF